MKLSSQNNETTLTWTCILYLPDIEIMLICPVCVVITNHHLTSTPVICCGYLGHLSNNDIFILQTQHQLPQVHFYYTPYVYVSMILQINLLLANLQLIL